MVVLTLAAPLAGCDNFSTFDNAPTPNVITVAGLWVGTAVTTACVPAPDAVVDFCELITSAGEFDFQLGLGQEEDRLTGAVQYANLTAQIGGVVTATDTVRLAGSSLVSLNGVNYTIVVRNFNADIVGGGLPGSRMSGTWVTEAVQRDNGSVARAEHSIVAAMRTR